MQRRIVVIGSSVILAGAAILGDMGCAASSTSDLNRLEGKTVTLVIDTQPSGAQIYREVRGGAIVECNATTPVSFVCGLWARRNLHGYRLVGVRTVNGTPIRTFPGTNVTSVVGGASCPQYSRDLGNGVFCKSRECENRKYDEADFSVEAIFQKPGYSPYSEKRQITGHRLWTDSHDGLYRLLIPLKPISPVTHTQETALKPGYILNLRIVAIPSGRVLSAASASATSKLKIPQCLDRLCQELWKELPAENKGRISIAGIVEIDQKAKAAEVGRFATESLYAALGEQRGITLTERSQIQEFLKENRLTLQDIVDNPKSLEKMVGIDYVVLGSVSRIDE
jgi:hypothetical protein